MPSSAKPLDYAAPADVPKKTSRRLVTGACMLVMVLSSMEMTITSTAMPTIIGDLHGLEHYAWVASLYALTCTVSMPLYGRLADTLGRKRVLIAAITIFLLASLLASTAHTMPLLILYRGLQGLGAGGIMPIVLTLLGDIFTIEERAKIQGYFSAIWGTASLAGPALGALLVNTFGWRSIFFVNLPPGLIAMAVLILFYHDPHKQHPSDTPRKSLLQHFDLPGFLALSLATSSLLVAVSIPFTVLYTPILLALSAASVFAFIRLERRAAEPILPPSLVARSDIWPSLASSLFHGTVFLSLDTYVPLYVQGGRGGGATAAASVVTPLMLAWALSGIVAAPLVVKHGFRFVGTLGAAIISIGMLGLLIATILSAPILVITAILLFTGFGLGPASMSALLAVQHAVDYRQRGTVTSSLQLSRTLGGAIGIGLHGALFTVLSAPAFARLSASTGLKPAEFLDPKTIAKLPADTLANAQHIISHNLLWVFASMLFFSLLHTALITRLPTRKPSPPPTPTQNLEAAVA